MMIRFGQNLLEIITQVLNLQFTEIDTVFNSVLSAPEQERFHDQQT
jgi:hypothetical protein